jgi:hypothetical protein
VAARVGLLAFVLVTPVSAVADEGPGLSSNHIEGARLDAHANFGGYVSLGAGMRVDLPLVRSGLLAGADDELALSAGADVFFTDFYDDYYDGGPYVIPSVVLQWNFYFAPQWSVFPEAGIAFYVGDEDYLPRGSSVYATYALGLGARYHFSDRNALLVRIATPTGLQVGATF